ncbi:MAG: SRPBCC family protein [Thermoplasmata archaeon]
MPTSTITFTLPAAPSRIVDLLKDPRFLASNIPQVVGVVPKTATTATWLVEIRLGPLTRRTEFQGELLEATESRVRFAARGADATIEGQIDLVPQSTETTALTLKLDMMGAGPLRVVIDGYLKRRVQGDAEAFASSLTKHLSEPPPPPPPAP